MIRKPKTKIYVSIDNVTTLARVENGAVVGFSEWTVSIRDIRVIRENLETSTVNAKDHPG